MKFSTVLGNPPYQTGKGETGGGGSLWRKLVKKSFELVEPNGYVAIVCPGFPHKAPGLKQHLAEQNTPLLLVNNAKEHFPGIGSSIKYWIVQEGKHSKPFIVDGTVFDLDSDQNPLLQPIENSIVNKMSGDCFECQEDSMYTSCMINSRDDIYVATPDAHNQIPIRHASRVRVCYVPKPTASHYKRKVMMTFSGYPGYEYYDENNPMSSCYHMSGYILVNNKAEADNLIDLYNSKLYRARRQIGKTGAMHGCRDYTMARVDLNKAWTDTELYAHFGLTQAEIDYVEEHS